MSDPTPPPIGDPSPLVVPIHYDFASSLCYVAHRVLGRMSDFLEATGLELSWQPIDLSALMGWRPGAKMAPHRLDDVRQIAAGLAIPIRVPERWQDSRRVGAATLALGLHDGGAHERSGASWRERVFTAVYEQGGRCDEEGLVERILADMHLDLPDASYERGLEALRARTIAAAESGVTGVPTFMLGEWPFGGIQEDATMRSILGRYARKQRERAAAH